MLCCRKLRNNSILGWKCFPNWLNCFPCYRKKLSQIFDTVTACRKLHGTKDICMFTRNHQVVSIQRNYIAHSHQCQMNRNGACIKLRVKNYSIEGLIELFCCNKGNSTNLEDVSIRGFSSVSKAAARAYKVYKYQQER